MTAHDGSSKHTHFSAFRTAGEELADRKKGEVPPDDSGRDHVSATRGRIVRTPERSKPYKVVLEHEGYADTEHPVATVREGEALIKRKTPRPIGRDTSRDR